MGLFDQFPYTNFHELNLDWILRILKEIETTIEQFVAINSLKYANPIQWDITRQYEKNTIVIDPQTGTAYISVQPVPQGVSLNNEDYWTVVFDLGSFVVRAAKNFTSRFEEQTTLTATFNTNAGEWLVWGDTLYRALLDIHAGDQYVIGSNIEHITIEEIKNYIISLIGDLNNLTTQDKSNLVSAINELVTDIGDLSTLDTRTTASIVDAINELVDDKIYVTAEMFGAVGDGITDDTAAIQAAINHADVVVLNNQYYVSSTINVLKGKAIKGTGTITTDIRGNIINLMGDNIVDGLTFTDTLAYDASSGNIIYSLNQSNLTVINCTFSTIGNGACVTMDHCNHITIKHNTLLNYGHSGIKLLHTCYYADIMFNSLTNARYTGSQHQYPITVSGYTTYDYGVARYIKCNYNTITQTDYEWEGIDSHGCATSEFIGNRITGVFCGIALGSKRTSSDSSFTDANCELMIKDNYIECGGVNSCGIRLSAEAVDVVSENIEISNNYVEVTADDTSAVTAVVAAISLRPDGVYKSVLIKNNTLKTTNAHCVALDGIFYNIEISENYIEGFTITNSKYYSVVEMVAIDSFYDIKILNNVVSPNVTGGQFSHGPNAAGLLNDLVEVKGNNVNTTTFSVLSYTTAPRAAMNANTIANGRLGQFIECTQSGTTLGWKCKGPSSWYSITGTAV